MPILQSRARRTIIGRGRRVISKRRFDMLSVSGLVLALEHDDASTRFQDTGGTTPAGIGDPVALWTDKSGSGNDVSQTTGANRGTATANGIQFTAAQSLNMPDLGTDGHSIFIVCRSNQDGPGGFGNIFRMNFASNRDPIIYVFGGDDNVRFSYDVGSGEEVTTAAMGHTATRLLSAYRAGTAVSATVDGANLVSDTLSGNPNATGAGAIGEFEGIIKYVYVFNRELSAAEKEQVNLHLLGKR